MGVGLFCYLGCMAMRMVPVFTDDVTGAEYREDQLQKVRFEVGGVMHELDLGPENHKKFVRAIGPFYEAALQLMKERVPEAPKPRKRPQREAYPAVADIEKRRAIREWWQENWEAAGVKEPTNRGRIPHEVTEAYEANGGKPVRKRRAPVVVETPFSG